MKFAKAKKKYPGKVRKVVGWTERRPDEGLYVNNHASYGFSYRGMWVHEGCPGTFEAWLVNKGVITK